jgi:hypothetical protein
MGRNQRVADYPRRRPRRRRRAGARTAEVTESGPNEFNFALKGKKK